MKVQIVCLNRLVFLPYVHGLLRGYIEQYTPDLARSLEWGDPIFLDEPADNIASRIDTDVLGLSCYVWNFKKQMKIAKLVKQRNPDAYVVAGGPHVPNHPGDFFREHPYVDVIVHGEGEITFANLLKLHLSDSDAYPVYGTSTPYFHHSVNSLFGEKLPKDIFIDSPYYAGYLDSAVAQARESGQEFWAPWETNRGCPYQCSFCDWGSSLMNKVRKFSIERLGHDLDFFGTNGIENVYICDANFGMLKVDEGITNALVASKEQTGYPKQIRGSFAKNSNDRVFNITKSLMDAGMIYGTTLSVQSMDENVLKAVDRENIGVEKYEELQKRYHAEGYHTYSEVILGLPEETKDSFIGGLCELIEAGNHEDIRVWELSILPNAPMAQHVDRYGLKTVTKNVFLELPKTDPAEVETNQIVVETATMPHDDWVHCYLFAWMIQTLHCGYYTRYIAEYLRREQGISYRKFYEGVFDVCRSLDDCMVGRSLEKVENLLRSYPNNTSSHLMQRAKGFGTTRRNPADWLWLNLCAHKDNFYNRIIQFLPEHVRWSFPLDDLMHFQKSIMLDPSYDPAKGHYIKVSHNWKEFFLSGEPLQRKPSVYVIKQTHTGIDDKYSLTNNSGAEFANAAVGSGFLVSRHRHYAHPLTEIQ